MTPTEKLRNASRPDVRPAPTNKDDPRERAAKRAAQIKDSLGGELDEGTDEFFVNPAEIPDGWTYEWKRKEVMGKEDHNYQTQLLRKGWEPVPADRHPDMMPPHMRNGNIERKGLVLMERPAEITNEARNIERKRARAQVQIKEDQLSAAPPGQFERNNKDNSLVKIKKHSEPMNIPED